MSETNHSTDHNKDGIDRRGLLQCYGMGRNWSHLENV